jgi:hypothetical protein
LRFPGAESCLMMVSFKSIVPKMIREADALRSLLSVAMVAGVYFVK